MFVVRMSRFCIAISICDFLLQTRWLWYFLLPGVWSWTLEWILMYFQETQGLLPGRFEILSNGKQNRSGTLGNRVFLAHMCPIYRKTAAGSCNGNQRWVEVIEPRVSVVTSPPRKQICFSKICCSRRFSLEGNVRCYWITKSAIHGSWSVWDNFWARFLFLAFNIWSF